MVIIKLFGGLGNQLFQYAFGKIIALQNNCLLKFDLSLFETDTLRRFELPHFNINETAASPAEIDRLQRKHFSLLSSYKRKLLNAKPNFVHHPDITFNPNYLALQKDVYIDGYWQSEKYFCNSAHQIKSCLAFKTPPSAANKQMLLQIAKDNAVSIHIRRGDYLTKEHEHTHGTCSMQYYWQAISLIADEIPNPVFYFFSDDMDWVRQNFDIPHNKVFVDINTDATAYEDLRLMSACKHHIIANSSFSWWGAWLNSSSAKMVIAPKQWFSNDELNEKAIDITPDSWIRL